MADLYAANRELLRLAGMKVVDAPAMELMGISVIPGPRVVLAPNFALGVGDLLHKVSGGSMSPRSTLIVQGPGDIRIENLDLNGTLIVRAVAGANVVLKGLVVSNKGWAIEALKEGRRAPEELRVRGFQLVKYEQRVIEFSQPGSYVVDE